MDSLRYLRLVSWFIWGALLMAVVIYLLVLQLSKGDSGGSDGSGTESMRSILLTVALIQTVMSFGVRFYVTRRSFAREREGVSRIGFGSYIVSLALAEACAIYGMLLGLLGAEASEYGIFFVLGFVGIALQPPTFFGKAKPS